MRSLLFYTILSFQLSTLVASESRVAAFVTECQHRLSSERVIKGEAPGWYFPSPEIKQLSLGNFWDKRWQEISRNQSDPVPSMIEFHNLLRSKNVDLLIVPIPSKATIYPDKLSKNFAPGEAQGIAPFIAKLRKKGLNVVDLEAHFLEKRKAGDEKKYWCAQDSHFSPMACVEIADLIAGTLERDFRIELRPNQSLNRSRPEEIQISGDLIDSPESGHKEKLSVQYVRSGNAIQSDSTSPVLLLGDSHTLVFSDEANFHCESAGLFDHLSSALGRALDLEGNAAGGLVTSRINLFRKATANPGYWDRKKAVVWVFTAREFTQSSYSRGFISIPIER